MKKIALLLTIVLSVLAYNISAQTNVTAELDSAKLLIGEQANFSIKVTSPQSALVKMPAYKAGDMLSNGIEIVGVSMDTTELSGDERLITSTVTITSWNQGTYTIAPQNISVAGKKFKTDQKTLKVLTVEVDTLHPEQIKPAKDVMDNPFSIVEWIPVAAWFVAAVILLALCFYLRKLLKSNRRIFPNINHTKKLLPHEKALLSIEKIKEEQQSQSVDQKTYYTQLTDTLREYLEERFSINAKEMTSGEIVDSLLAEEDMTKVDELRELFTTADLVKFAKYSTPNNENVMYLTNVARFVEETKRDEMPETEPSEAEKLEEERQNKRQRQGIKALIAIVAIAAIGILVYVTWMLYELLM